MFIPNQTCTYYQRTNVQDIFGGYVFDKPLIVPCTVVSMDIQVKRTSVRSDSSASRGRAEEEVGLVRILFPSNLTFSIQEKDVVFANGYALEVSRIFPRRDVLGNLDHWQIDFGKGTIPS